VFVLGEGEGDWSRFFGGNMFQGPCQRRDEGWSYQDEGEPAIRQGRGSMRSTCTQHQEARRHSAMDWCCSRRTRRSSSRFIESRTKNRTQDTSSIPKRHTSCVANLTTTHRRAWLVTDHNERVPRCVWSSNTWSKRPIFYEHSTLEGETAGTASTGINRLIVVESWDAGSSIP
jgi:hypothetical protein